MTLFLASLGLLMLGGVVALALARWPTLAARASAAAIVLGCATGLVAAVHILLAGETVVWRRPWMTPLGGEFALTLDPLAGFFLISLFLVCGLAAIYGVRYLAGERGAGRVASAWSFSSLLVASMAVVVAAHNGLLFLVSWEVMALASFFLVTHDDERPEVRQAGRLYLIATHLGTVFLLALFLVAASRTGSLDFDTWQTLYTHISPQLAGLLFVCALLGFGTKAGFMPLHVWLPEAHPAAPSHISAVMSGVMIKTGIYGLVRFLPFLGPPPLWWGWTLVAIGLSSGVLGVLFALAQHDMKRLLAYHSVENIGIIALGLGVGLLGLTLHEPVMIVTGFAGALLHVLNHALFKSLLFLGAGAVYRATHTREIDELGGLLRRMPGTAACFLTGAAAISGLPPLNGFVSEFLIYWGAFYAVCFVPLTGGVPGLAVIGGLALIGGLAAACFAKLFGIVFLGEPRSGHAAEAVECGHPMRWPMFALAAACLAIGFLPFLAVDLLRPAVSAASGCDAVDVHAALIRVMPALRCLAAGAAGLVALVALLAVLRVLALRRRPVEQALTWDCGYARPTPRMQYTASSFAQPLVELFAWVLRSRRRFAMGAGYFPAAGSLATETRDLFRERLFMPLFLLMDRWLSLMKWLQSGRVQLYVMYIVVTLLALLVWSLGVGG